MDVITAAFDHQLYAGILSPVRLKEVLAEGKANAAKYGLTVLPTKIADLFNCETTLLTIDHKLVVAFKMPMVHQYDDVFHLYYVKSSLVHLGNGQALSYSSNDYKYFAM